MATFTGTNANNTIDAVTGIIFGFTGGTIAQLQDGLGDTLRGLNGDDYIRGGSGADIIEGGLGNDTLFGQDGNDTLYANTSADPDGSNFGDEMNGGDGEDRLKGSGGDDTLNGDAGNDMLKGGGGADIFNGGTGVDTASYINSSVGVLVDLEANSASGGDALGDTFNSIENIIGSGYDDLLTGDNGLNVISGGEGDDIVQGGLSSDTLNGGEGDDTLVAMTLDNQDGSGADDTMNGDSGNDTLKGSGGDDTLNGGDDNDTLKGGGGADALNGGDGNDTADYSRSSSRVTVNLDANTGTGGNAEGDTYSSIETVNGSDHNDILTGTERSQTLNGGAGNDILEGEFEDDTLNGGAGNDVLYAMTAMNIGGSIIGDTMNGDAGDDTLKGSGGADVMNGGTGMDTMTGGLGNDTYVVDNASDTVTEFYGEGSDIVATTISYDVPLNVEVLQMQGSGNINSTGTNMRDIIQGNVGENIIDGGEGFDVMAGGGGNDVYAVDNSMDAVIEEAGGGYDNVYSSVDYQIEGAQEIESAILTGTATVLRGSSSDNQLFGNDEINVIDGREGTDYMLGLGGADIFQINLEAGAQDIVGDFSKAEGDRMAFTGFNQATTFVNQASATSFEVRDTKGTMTLADDTVQTFILNDSYGSGTYTQGALEFGVDYYFG